MKRATKSILVLCSTIVALAAASLAVVHFSGHRSSASSSAYAARQRVHAMPSADTNWVQDPHHFYHRTSLAKPNSSVSVPILEYHDADYVPGNIATLMPGQFSSEMAWLRKNGFHTINFGQLYAAMYYGYKLPQRPILLTFDDGYESVYTKVLPVLKQYRYQATVFVVAGFTHGTPNKKAKFPVMTTGQVQALQRSGLVDIEDHTMYHRDLRMLSDVEAKYEIGYSKLLLQEMVHHKMAIFAFPDGNYNAKIISFVKNAGYLLAVSQAGGYASLNNGPFTLHRISVLSFTTLSDFANRLRPSFALPSGQTAQADYLAGAKAFGEKNYVAAIQFEDAAIGLNPTLYQAYNVRGIALCYASDNSYTTAMQSLNKALSLNPNDGYTRFNKALCEERYTHYDAAIQTYLSALRLKSHDWWVPWSYYGIASIYGRRGDVTNTVKYLDKAIAISPSIKQAARTEADFNHVRYSALFQQAIQ